MRVASILLHDGVGLTRERVLPGNFPASCRLVRSSYHRHCSQSGGAWDPMARSGITHRSWVTPGRTSADLRSSGPASATSRSRRQLTRLTWAIHSLTESSVICFRSQRMFVCRPSPRLRLTSRWIPRDSSAPTLRTACSCRRGIKGWHRDRRNDREPWLARTHQPVPTRSADVECFLAHGRSTWWGPRLGDRVLGPRRPACDPPTERVLDAPPSPRHLEGAWCMDRRVSTKIAPSISR